MKLKQYQLVLVNLYPTIGSEMKKTRPCLILSPDEMNKYLQTVVVAPITSTSKDYPTRHYFSIQEIQGWIVLDQIRSIDQQRILKVIGKLDQHDVLEVKKIIHEAFVL